MQLIPDMDVRQGVKSPRKKTPASRTSDRITISLNGTILRIPLEVNGSIKTDRSKSAALVVGGKGSKPAIYAISRDATPQQGNAASDMAYWVVQMLITAAKAESNTDNSMGLFFKAAEISKSLGNKELMRESGKSYLALRLQKIGPQDGLEEFAVKFGVDLQEIASAVSFSLRYNNSNLSEWVLYNAGMMEKVPVLTLPEQ